MPTRVANDPRRRRDAVSAAVAVARRLGLPADDPVVLHDGSNVLVHLRPAAIVARVPATTALARSDPADNLAREIALTRALSAAGAAVLAPTTSVDPGPHRHAGQVLTLWPLVTAGGPSGEARGASTPAPAGGLDMAGFGRALAALHRALAAVGAAAVARGEPPLVPPAPPLHPALGETALLLRRLEALGALAADDATLLRGAHAEVARALRASPLPLQPVHGDAHARNVIATADGPLWFDFEDCCIAPVAWDLACLIVPSALAAEPALEAYAAAGGALPAAAELAPFLDARDLQITAWSLLFATRFPDLAAAATARVAGWRRRSAD